MKATLRSLNQHSMSPILYNMIELCIDRILFTHSFINGHSHRFPLLAVMTSAAVKTLATNISSRPCFQFAWLYTQKWDCWDIWSLLFSCSVMSDSLWPHGLQHARLSCLSSTPRACSNSYPLSRWCHPTISSSVSPSSPAFNLSQHQGLFQWVSSSHQVAKVLELQLQHQSFQWIFRVDFL